MKKIVVPTDFSQHAENAMLVASQIAKKSNAKIIAIHMLGLQVTDFNKASSQEALEGLFHIKLAKKNFKSFLDKDYLKGIEIEERVQSELAFNQLNEIARQEEADLIIMGSHGTSGFTEDVFVGSNTEKMVRNSEVPVLVIKEKIKNFKLNKVVFACDFKKENASAYRKAVDMFNSFGASVHMLYVNTPSKFLSNREITAKVSSFLKEVNSDNEVLFYNDYTVESGVFNYSDEINADAIAIPTHGRRGLAHFFTGSIGEDIANHSERPVITFKI